MKTTHETYRCACCGSTDIHFYPSVNPNKAQSLGSVSLLEEIMSYAEMSCAECGNDTWADEDGWLECCEDRRIYEEGQEAYRKRQQQ